MNNTDQSPQSSLSRLARELLLDLLLSKKLSAGDLIKLLNVDDDAESPRGADFVIRLYDQED
ncbi:MAG: hypothetical protein GX171_01930 [Clostridiales bacterium]|jgi:hypothetical protein|nr:hypothetical protein [Clostridiales bacterium]